MDALLATVLSNAIITTALALLVFGVGLRVRRPALLHGLWLLVLLKLVTPPVFTIAWEPSAPAAPAGEPTLRRTIPLEAPTIVPEEMPASPPVPVSPQPRESTPIPWQQMLLTLWIGGSAAWMVLVAVRLYRFRRLLKEARLAPEWVAEETRLLAGRIGLSRVPPVSLLPGAISPMIFAFGSAARILLPQELLTSLSREAARSLLAHELAHLRRRDHWIRILELVVTGIYWWLPTLWWARRELRKAEEECCDAWVVWALPDQEEEYAEALVRVVGLLSRSPVALPPVASGIGHFSELKRRISMVMEGSTPHRLSTGARSMLLGLALLVPLIPAWAQEKPESREAARREEREKAVQALQERVVLHRSVFESLPADSPLRREKLIALRRAELDLEVAREDLYALTGPPSRTAPPTNPAPVVPPPTPEPAPQAAPDSGLSATDPKTGSTVRVLKNGHTLECVSKEGKVLWQAELGDQRKIQELLIRDGKVHLPLGETKLFLDVATGKIEIREGVSTELTAKVTAVSQEPGLVVISIGKDQGVVEGRPFAINRDGRFIAKIVIDRADRKWSAGRILYKSGDPRVGDDVSSVIPSRSGNPVPEAGSVHRPLTGKIALCDAARGMLALDVRQSDGARPGMRLEVRRLAQKIGTIVITDVQPWGSWAKPDGDLKVHQVQKGDLVEGIGEKQMTPEPGGDSPQVDVLKVRVEIQLARLREAEIAAEHSARRLERIRVLVQKGLAGQSELIERQNEVDLGQSQVAIRRAELKEAELLLSQAEAAVRKSAPLKPK